MVGRTGLSNDCSMEKAPAPTASNRKVRLGEEERAGIGDPFASRLWGGFTERGDWNNVEDTSI
jgi:hypothetical protein